MRCELIMTQENDEMLKVGDKVEILGNARGTAWKTGYIASIDGNNEALIKCFRCTVWVFGSKCHSFRRCDMRSACSELHATELIYNAAGTPPINMLTQHSGNCAVCGQPISEGVPINKVVSNAFTDWNMLADMSASHVCAACTWCIKEPKMRRSQYMATMDGLVYFKRDAIERYLFAPPTSPFVIFITSSYKKHGSFRARVNHSQTLFYVQFEDREILFGPTRYRPLYELMKKMYATFNKTQEIGRGDYISKRVFSYGLTNWQRDEAVLKQYRGSQVFGLLLYALNKPEDDTK